VSGLFLVLAVAAFAWALAGRWTEIAQQLADQNLAVLLAALAIAVAGVFMSFLLWRGTLAFLGSRLDLPVAARLFFVTQLGKYLPGAVWPVLAQMRTGRLMGIPRQRMGLAFLLTLGLATLVGFFVGALALPSLLSAEGPLVLLGLLALPVFLLLLLPPVLNRLLARALAVMGRPAMDQSVASADVLRGVVWSLAFWVVYGAHVWVLAVGLGADPLRTLPVAVGGFAIAFGVGPLLVVLPAGAGVREAVLVVVLSAVLSTADATVVALTSRVILMLADGLLAAGSVIAARRQPAAPLVTPEA
jgi:uncharacterized membrane protein YbhN (UPF0104 family)